MEVLQRTANRGSISTDSYEIDNSLKMESDNSESMNRTPSSSGNRKTWTLSFWFKRTELGATERLFEAWDGSTGTSALFDTANKFLLDLTAGGNYFTSTAVFRDTSAWYHFVIRVDTTQGTASERARIYVNGSELAGSWNSNIGQNTDLTWNQNVVHYLGVFHNTGNFVNGYYAEIINVDGTSLAPTAFGEVDSASGIWKPKAASPTYGTNGFKLEFKTAGGLGADTSGNGHTWTLNNIAAADQATDTPTNNFCTWNPLWVYASQPVISEGATKVRIGDSTNEGAKATIGLTNGKWYWEAKPVGTIGAQQIGIQTDGDSNISSNANSTANNYGMWINATGRYYTYADSQTESADQGWDLTASDWLGIALDMDSGTQTIKFYKNGSLIQSLNLISDMQGRTVFPFLMNYENRSFDINFGGYTINTISSAASDANGYGTFEYAPPSGYLSICTKNLAETG